MYKFEKEFITYSSNVCFIEGNRASQIDPSIGVSKLIFGQKNGRCLERVLQSVENTVWYKVVSSVLESAENPYSNPLSCHI